MNNTNNQLKSHDYPEVYKGLGINLSSLGCVMLDLEPLLTPFTIGEDKLYYAKDKSRFWINGYVASQTPHVTLLYGLLETAKNYSWHIEQVLKGWKLDTVRIKDFGFFPSPYQDEEYYCIVAHLEITPELMEGHQRLEFLPHVNTFAGYKAHFTIAYIKKDEAYRDNFIKMLNETFAGKDLKVRDGINLGGNK